MEGGLPVEHDIVIVSQVPFHDIASVQMRIGSVFLVGKVYLLSISSDDVLGTRPLIGSIGHQSSHLVQVLSGHVLRHSEIGRDQFWNSQLVKLKDRVWSNNSSG